MQNKVSDEDYVHYETNCLPSNYSLLKTSFAKQPDEKDRFLING